VTTDRTRLWADAAADSDTGYRRLRGGAGEPHLVRTELAPALDSTPAQEVLLSVAHLSDLHVCDAQSPARVEFLDRWADPDSPILELVGEVGAYRAHEILTVQVVEATVRAVNKVAHGPVARAPLDFAIITGDNTDNAQTNELGWYIALLEGGSVHPDSGDLTRYEGVADGDVFDERFWHPETEQDDLLRSIYGFPRVPGLLDALRAPFQAAGLTVPWYAVHGNHDRMMQGTVPAVVPGVGPVGFAAVGSRKPIAFADGSYSPEQILAVLGGLSQCEPAALDALLKAQTRSVTADAARRLTSRHEFVAAHFGSAARPLGHGFRESNTVSGLAYYRQDHGPVTTLVLDTVDEHGGWQGSLDVAQFEWLATELESADADHRYVVLASHHPLETLVNSIEGDGGRRILADELAALLARHRCVVLWLAGHTHEVAVVPRGTYWQVVAPSLIDWPQQGRIVELLRGGGQLRILATMLDHAGIAPWDGSIDTPEAMAGLSRELSANDWQWLRHPLHEHPRGGRIEERNAELLLPDPWA
jgi:metallophosphoesterase (TIGR03767 family)